MRRPVRRATIIEAAAIVGLDLRNTVAIGTRVIGLTDDDRLVQWSPQGRWLPLVVDGTVGARQRERRTRRRRKGYAGHPASNASVRNPQKEDRLDVEVARTRLSEIEKNPGLLISGAELRAELDRLLTRP